MAWNISPNPITVNLSIGRDSDNFGKIIWDGNNGKNSNAQITCQPQQLVEENSQISPTTKWTWTFYEVPGLSISSAQGHISYRGRSYTVYSIPGIPEIGYIIISWYGNNYGSARNADIGNFSTFNIRNGPITPLLKVDIPLGIALVKLVNGDLPASLGNSQILFDAFKFHLADIRYSYSYNGDDFYFYKSDPLQAIVVRVAINLHTINATCTTPSFPTVKLPFINQSDFTGQTAGEVPFELEFTNCPPYMTDIHFRAESSGGTSPSPNNGFLPLTSGSSASGVVVQVLRGLTGYTPLKLNEWTTLSQYNKSATTSQNFTLPFRARYYKTSNTITPGTVRAAMIVHIQYQ